MLNIEKAKQSLLDEFLPDFNVTLKSNNKGVVTVTFIDEDTHGKVNLKFNENTGVTTVAPREMDKEEFQARIKVNMEIIKKILNECNISEKDKWEKCNTCGDYEYCAGNYGTDKCTGFIPGDSWNSNEK